MKRIISEILIFILIFGVVHTTLVVFATSEDSLDYDYEINLSDLSEFTTYSSVEELEEAKDDEGNLPEGVYITTFLYDGVGEYKDYDLDDFITSGNDMTVKTVSLTVVNINTTGNIEITGELTGGMIAVNTNGKTGELNLYLNNVTLNTNSKKAPAIYVYNQDINYEDCVVTIKTVEGTSNTVIGGKFKKVSLVGSDELSDYSGYYSGDYSTYYDTYTNYYGVYTSEEIENILFAKVKAKSDDLAEGDPYYYYKGAGAISSDIDLYFEGEGSLYVSSLKKEGIESKGNLTFSGGTGDYVVDALDDALNTTTSKESAVTSTYKNTLTINVNSMAAIVDKSSSEGDAIDSNGELYIEGGTIIALSCPTSGDAGLDSDSGTYINGGTVVAIGTGTMDSISTSSEQNVMQLTFSETQTEGSIIFITDTNGDVIMAFESDRSFNVLDYSSAELENGDYYVFVGSSVTGTDFYGLYTSSDYTEYTLGEQYQWGGRGTSFDPSANHSAPGSSNSTESITFSVSSMQSSFTNVAEYSGTTELEGYTYTLSSADTDDDTEDDEEGNTAIDTDTDSNTDSNTDDETDNNTDTTDNTGTSDGTDTDETDDNTTTDTEEDSTTDTDTEDSTSIDDDDTSTDTDDDTTTSTEDDETEEDTTTTSETTLPQTGSSDDLTIKSLIITFMISAIVFYIKNKIMEF